MVAKAKTQTTNRERNYVLMCLWNSVNKVGCSKYAFSPLQAPRLPVACGYFLIAKMAAASARPTPHYPSWGKGGCLKKKIPGRSEPTLRPKDNNISYYNILLWFRTYLVVYLQPKASSVLLQGWSRSAVGGKWRCAPENTCSQLGIPAPVGGLWAAIWLRFCLQTNVMATLNTFQQSTKRISRILCIVLDDLPR